MLCELFRLFVTEMGKNRSESVPDQISAPNLSLYIGLGSSVKQSQKNVLPGFNN